MVRLPDAVLWHEGMLLAPQHFQQASLRGEELLHYRLRAAAPFGWGVRSLRVDLQQLAGGTYRVTELDAILPDGVVAFVRADRDGPLEVDLKPYQEDARRGTVTVHLAVPAARAPGEPVAGQLARYDRVEGAPVADENTGDGEIPVPRLRPRLSLLVAPTAPDKYASLPLARIRFRDGAFVLTTYMPPVPAVAPETLLHGEVRELARRIRDKALFFAERARAAASRPRDATTGDLSRVLGALLPALPRLDALVSLGRAHPLELHLALCDVAGLLAGVDGRVPPVFRRYDHLDPRASLCPVLAWCGSVLDTLQKSFNAVPFTLRDGVYQATPPAPAAGSAPATLVVGVRPGTLTEGDAAVWMEQCRIGSASCMASLAGRRIRGAARRRLVPTGELALAAGAGVMLFQVSPAAEYVVPGEPLQVAHPDEPGRRQAPAELVLYTRVQPTP